MTQDDITDLKDRYTEHHNSVGETEWRKDVILLLAAIWEVLSESKR